MEGTTPENPTAKTRKVRMYISECDDLSLNGDRHVVQNALNGETVISKSVPIYINCFEWTESRRFLSTQSMPLLQMATTYKIHFLSNCATRGEMKGRGKFCQRTSFSAPRTSRPGPGRPICGNVSSSVILSTLADTSSICTPVNG